MKGTWETTSGGDSPMLPLIVVGGLVLLASGGAAAISHALAVAIIIIVCTIVLVIVAGIAYLIWRARQNGPRRAFVPRPVYHLPPAETPRLERSQPRQLPSPQIVNNFYGYTPEQMAQALAQQQRAIEGGQ